MRGLPSLQCQAAGEKVMLFVLMHQAADQIT